MTQPGTGDQFPVVRTRYGAVRGKVQEGLAAFRAIPYGGRADGVGRFQVAGPPQPWSGTRDATVTGPRSVQSFGNLFQTRLGEYFTGGRIGELGLNDQRDSENCLVLNVLTPAVGAGGRPVLVYLHGGGLNEGSGVLAVGAYGLPREQDVVLVSVNHRLNVFGFLYLGHLDQTFADSGNIGLLDLVLALRWVRDNIELFGGDPQNVTLFGESGGGAKVCALMAMPVAQGLFHKAAVESGSLLRAITAEEAARVTGRLLDRLGLELSSVRDILDVPPDVLLRSSQEVHARFGPVIDGRNLPRHPFEPDAPSLCSRVPLIVGYCEDETTWLLDPDGAAGALNDEELPNRLAAVLDLPARDMAVVVATYRALYPTLSDVGLFFRITSYATFGESAERQAERKAAQGCPVYKYFFRYDTRVEEGRYGAFYTAKLPLVLRLVMHPEAEQLSRHLAGAWAAFAHTGDPSHSGLQWPRLTADARETMVFDVQSTMMRDPMAAERKLWSGLPFQDPFTGRFEGRSASRSIDGSGPGTCSAESPPQ
jgi:para-nitrobenzyl esterase